MPREHQWPIFRAESYLWLYLSWGRIPFSNHALPCAIHISVRLFWLVRGFQENTLVEFGTLLYSQWWEDVTVDILLKIPVWKRSNSRLIAKFWPPFSLHWDWLLFQSKEKVLSLFTRRRRSRSPAALKSEFSNLRGPLLNTPHCMCRCHLSFTTTCGDRGSEHSCKRLLWWLLFP